MSKSFEVKIAFVAVILGVMGILFYRFHVFAPASAYVVTGQVVEFSQSDGTIKIDLVHVFKDGTTAPEADTQSTVTIQTSSSTKFIGTVLHRPSKEDLAKTKGVWDMKTVKKDTVNGDISKLSKGSSISVKTTSNNPQGDDFAATEVNYYGIVD